MKELTNRGLVLQMVLVFLACTGMVQSCARDSVKPSELERLELRAKLHDRVARNIVVSNRQSWEIIAAGSRLSNGNIRLFYRRDAIEQSHRASGPNQHRSDYWNREHIWPQSYGLRGTPAARDLHNIVPADRTVNTSRGNKIVDSARTPHKECLQCRSSSSTWEPPDAVKGDVARILFYMDVRYEGDDSSPDLSLSDTPDKDAAVFGRLSTLLGWHCLDPVSDEERLRNNTVAQAQGNRNVFVDRPELAEMIYGFRCKGGRME